MATAGEAALGSLAFLVFWASAMFPSFPLLPLGRTAGAVAGAALMVLFRLEPPDGAYAAVDLPILAFLFAAMLLTHFLERAGLLRHLAALLAWRLRGPRDLLCRLSLLVAIASALASNDACCLALTRLVLALCRRHNLPPEPFLLALASSSNIGSSATPIGNPQNLVVSLRSGIPFHKFLLAMAPAAALGTLVNTSLILALYWKQLSRAADRPGIDERSGIRSALSVCCGRDDPRDFAISAKEGLLNQPMSSGSVHSVTETRGIESVLKTGHHSNEVDIAGKCSIMETRSVDSGSYFSIHHELCIKDEQVDAEEERAHSSTLEDNLLKHDWEICSGSSAIRWKKTAWKVCVYVVALGMMAAFLFGFSLTWSALTAAVALMALDFENADPVLDKVSYPLLVFFSGMFITVDGFNKTGIPTRFWNAVEPYAHVNNASGLAVLALVVLTLSNAVSNVPTVLLLGPRIAQSTELLHNVSADKAWLILAWTSTIAGNLTLIGSAANLIVCEQARKVPSLGCHLTFLQHLRYGFPATLIVVTIGLPFIQG